MGPLVSNSRGNRRSVSQLVSQSILVQILVWSWTLLPFCLGDTVKLLFQPMPPPPSLRDFPKSIAFWKVPRLRPFVSLVRATCRRRWALRIFGMLLRRENWSTRWKTCSSVSLSGAVVKPWYVNKFNSYLTESILRVGGKDQPVSAVLGSNNSFVL